MDLNIKKILIGVSILGAVGFIFLGISALVYGIGVANSETVLRQTIIAKQRDNTSEFDNMWKKISQVAQVTDKQKDALKEIIVGYANARSGKSGGSLATWIQETVPNVDTTTFTNLQNIITASRDSWTFRQKELLDLSREHNILINKFPSNIVCSLLNRGPIDIQIVTSTRTENSFATGKDDDVQVK